MRAITFSFAIACAVVFGGAAGFLFKSAGPAWANTPPLAKFTTVQDCDENTRCIPNTWSGRVRISDLPQLTPPAAPARR
jgi:hypothetical protein